ncbi:134aa long hypothetical protein [Pyrococcus horikoshii OT3]|uniref:Uncharacterized protein n=1 Tax=Pyrococcus horikoshii (strain ATCC 700860 / DSM 12428 / JCM 9974 / NBRC 100139 / OT-3) TaxID=70601 RepID=O58583_PYRHO|nr:134aa long hypothetical protein [Pyrococcus horikoshii OT3]
MIKFFVKYKFLLMFSGKNSSPVKTFFMVLSISSSNTKLSGRITLSTEEFVKSLSCQSGLFSNAGITLEYKTLASPQTFSVLMGFLLWGIVDEPTCFSPKGSLTSSISVLCRFLISNPILSRVEATKARKKSSSA